MYITINILLSVILTFAFVLCAVTVNFWLICPNFCYSPIQLRRAVEKSLAIPVLVRPVIPYVHRDILAVHSTEVEYLEMKMKIMQKISTINKKLIYV